MSDAPPDGFLARMQAARAVDPTPARVEARRLADAMRAVTGRLVSTRATADDLARAADAVEAIAAALEPGGGRDGIAEASLAASLEGHPDGSTFFDTSPIIGRSNPLAPPVDLEFVEGRIVGHARFGAAYEGPPGSVHGGYVAAAFDDVLGMTQSLSGRPGMTGTLTVRYRRPTPLHTDLVFEGELLRVEGRKIFTEGRLFAEGELRAEAEAIFISVDFTKLAEGLGRGRPPA